MTYASTSPTGSDPNAMEIIVTPPPRLGVKKANMTVLAQRLDSEIDGVDIKACRVKGDTLVVSCQSNRLTEAVKRLIDRALRTLAGLAVSASETLTTLFENGVGQNLATPDGN